MSNEKDKDSGGGLSVVDLAIAAISSAAAALIVSQFWKGGTAISAAVTPVLVTLIREALAKPAATKVGEVTSRVRERVDVPAAAGAAAPYDEDAAPTEEALPPAYDQGGAYDSEPGVSVYGRSRRSKIHLRLALITGLLGFAIAAIVLTAPELLFGKSVTGSGRTTIFQGRDNDSDKKSDDTKDSTTTAPDETVTEEAPTVTEEAPTVTEQAPTETLPTETVPAPQAAPQDQLVPDDGGAEAPATP